MIINSIKDTIWHTDPEINTESYQRLSYPIDQDLIDKVSGMLLPGRTAYLFSGSWRFVCDSDDVSFVELKVYKNSNLLFHPKTLFVEPNDTKLYSYLLKKINASNLVILHSDYWAAHLPVEDLVEKINELTPYTKQVICTLPIRNFNFNKLKLTVGDVCRQTNGIVHNDSVIITR